MADGRKQPQATLRHLTAPYSYMETRLKALIYSYQTQTLVGPNTCCCGRSRLQSELKIRFCPKPIAFTNNTDASSRQFQIQFQVICLWK